MDYTTVTAVKLALGAVGDTADEYLAALITRASRAIDRQLYPGGPDDYLLLTEVTETLRGHVDANGVLHCWARKPVITEVLSLAYRATPREAWLSASLTDVMAEGYHVRTYGLTAPGNLWVQLNYTGGLAATPDELPADLFEAATVLAVRFYREAETGLTDAIGVAELGTLTYTKALPARVVALLSPYVRRVP